MQDLKCHVKSKILSNHNMPRTSKLLVQLNLQSNGQRVTCSHSGQNHLKSDSKMDWQLAWLNVLLLETFIKWAMSGEAQVNFSKAFTVTSITSSWFAENLLDFKKKHFRPAYLLPCLTSQWLATTLVGCSCLGAWFLSEFFFNAQASLFSST